MSEDEQTALIHWPHGWEYYLVKGWRPCFYPSWDMGVVYRGKPAPVVTTAHLEGLVIRMRKYKPTNPINSGDSRLVSCRVSEDVFRLLDDLAKKTDTPFVTTLRRVIENGIYE